MIRLKGLLKEQPEVKESEFVDDDDIIKFKDENGKPREMKAGAAKTMKQGSPAKKAWDDANEKGQKAAAGGGDDDKKDTTGVSFDRTAGEFDHHGFRLLWERKHFNERSNKSRSLQEKH